MLSTEVLQHSTDCHKALQLDQSILTTQSADLNRVLFSSSFLLSRSEYETYTSVPDSTSYSRRTCVTDGVTEGRSGDGTEAGWAASWMDGRSAAT